MSDVSSVTAEMTASLEQQIDGLLAEHRLRPAFVVTGATPSFAALDIAQTSLRRAERRLVAARESGMPVSAALIAYVNRTSDLCTCWRDGPPVMATSRSATSDPSLPLWPYQAARQTAG